MVWLQSHPAANNQTAGSKEGQTGDIRLIPAVKAIFGEAPSPEWDVVKRTVLRNSLNPDSINFEKWFPAKNASSEDSNAIGFRSREDPKVRARLQELDESIRNVTFPVAPLEPAMAIGTYAGSNDVGLVGGERITNAEYQRRKDEYERNQLVYRANLDDANSQVNEYKQE